MVDGGGGNNRRDLKMGCKSGVIKESFQKNFDMGWVKVRIILRWGVERF